MNLSWQSGYDYCFLNVLGPDDTTDLTCAVVLAYADLARGGRGRLWAGRLGYHNEGSCWLGFHPPCWHRLWGLAPLPATADWVLLSRLLTCSLQQAMYTLTQPPESL